MRLETIASRYKSDANFLCIYIREAHPTDESQSPPNLVDQILYRQPKTIDERAEIAEACLLRFNFSFPMLLDDMTDKTERTYMALPERLYILDDQGVVYWKCGLGPHLFDPEGFDRELGKLIKEK